MSDGYCLGIDVTAAKLPFSFIIFKLLPLNFQSINTDILRIISLLPWKVGYREQINQDYAIVFF